MMGEIDDKNDFKPISVIICIAKVIESSFSTQDIDLLEISQICIDCSIRIFERLINSNNSV